MPKRYSNYGRKVKKTSKPRYTEAEKMAYQMGRVARGLKNPNSRVHESYKKGLNGKSAKNKKPLF